MSDILAHRGSDGEHTWVDGNVGLGHRMLWTTPESLNEHLPLVEKSTGCTITADARIDNREELYALLEIRKPIAVISDSELILAAYAKWGESCPEKLIGDFVFVIWDSRKHALFCARDPIGVKHFYYYYSPGRFFAFASEIKALLGLRNVPQQLNELSVANHLLPTYEDKINTLYQGIVRLPANHSLLVEREALKFRQYWMPDLSRELRLRSDEDYAEAFREIFTEAVRCRLRSAFPVGSMLSGGLDSSSITCVASRLLAEDRQAPLHTFSAVWPSLAENNPKIDERCFMNAVIGQGGVEPHYIYADKISPLDEWEKLFWHQDNAVSAPNMYMDWAIFKEARKQGVRILMGGTDGDTTVTYGYEDLVDFVRRGWWIRLAKEISALSRNMPRRSSKFRKLIWNSAFNPVIPESIKQVGRLLRGRPRVGGRATLPGHCRTRPFNPEFAQRIGLRDHYWNLQDDSYPLHVTTKENHWYGVTCGMWAYILESFEKAGAAQSLELRYPFFDQRLIEFCLALPPGQKLNGGWTRSILRRAMTGILPPEVQWRTTKGNLSAGVNAMLLEYEREILEETILHKTEAIEGYVDVPAVQTIYRRYVSNPLASSDDVFTLMLIVNLSLWLRNSGLLVQSDVPAEEPVYA